MSVIDPPVQLRYWGLRPSSELDAAVADASERLRPFRDRIERCELHFGRWAMHHDQGFVYRATLVVAPTGGGAAIALEEESDLHAGPHARSEIVSAVFARAASRLAQG